MFESDPNSLNRENLSTFKVKLLGALKQEKSFWHQKMRCRWLLEGEANTRLLYASVKARNSKLVNHRIKDKEGNWISDSKAIQDEFIDHFKNLFKAYCIEEGYDLLEFLNAKVPDIQNQC